MRAQAARLAPTADNRRWWTLAAMSFALFMIMLDNTVVNVALPTIQRELDASIAGLQWTMNAYTLAFGVLLVTGGRLGDIFGRRKVFLLGVGTFAGSSLAIGFSPDETWMIAFRALQGVGAAMMMPATLSIITNVFPPHERGKAIGTWAGVSAVALAIGPLVGGFLTEEAGWHWIFFLNVPVAIGAVIVTLFATRESRDDTVEKRVDIPGVAALSAGLGALVLALVQSNTWGWDSPRIIALLAFSVVGLAAFAYIETHTRVPMVDFQFFKSRSFFGASTVAFFVSFAMLAMFFFLALYMQNVHGFSPLEAGVRFLPSTLVVMVVGPIAGRLADKVGPRLPMTVGMTIVAGALVWMSFFTVDTGDAFMLPAYAMMGLGIGLVMAPMSTAAMNAVHMTKAGVASGVLSMSRMVGGTFGIAVLGALLASSGGRKLAELLPNVPDDVRHRIADALGSGAGEISANPQVVSAAHEAYVSAMSFGLRLSAVLVIGAAIVAWALVGRDRAAQEPAPEPVPAAPAPVTGELAAAPAAQPEPERV
jgi:EmrB/QacA subfamily drug resistance transporter